MDIFSRYKALKKLDFCLAYLDNFSDSATDALVAMQDSRTQTSKKLRKKISFLMTECFQNVIRHTEDSSIDFDKLFVVQSKGEYHKIITINPINTEKRASLEASLNLLKKLDDQQLKQIYLESLTGNNFSQKGGAGLGLIEMFRKSNQLPSYAFHKISDEITTFRLELDIVDDPDVKRKKKKDVSDDFYEDLSINRVLILQKSNFSQETVLALFELIENNQSDARLNASRSKKLYLLIELLQNMSTNMVEMEGLSGGIFQISLSEDNQLIFETGNYILNNHAELLKNRLESIKSLSKIELLKLYNQELLRGVSEENQEINGGIGLLEILKLTDRKMEYEIHPVNNSVSFITFKAMIEK